MSCADLVLGQQLFFESTYKNASSARRANFDFDKIHNRALFDGFNEAVNWFRPYYAISSFVLIQTDRPTPGTPPKKH